MTDDLTASLDQIRKRGYRNGATGATLLAGLSDAAAVDVPRLVAAIEAAMNVAGECEQKSAKLWEQISATLHSKGVGPELRASTASAYSNAAAMIREAITRELTKEAGDE